MKTITLLLAFSLASATAAFGQAAPAKQRPIEPGDADKLTITQCLGILGGLNLLDGQKVVVAAGKSNEAVEVVPYKFKGAVRDAISHNIFVLGQVQQEAQEANRRIQIEVGKGKTIAPGSVEATELDVRLSEYLKRPCKVELDHLKDSDLNLDGNPIPGSVLAALHPIRERGQ